MDALGVGISSNNYFNMAFWVAQHEGFFASEGIKAGGFRYESEAQNLGWLQDETTQYAFTSTETIVAEVDAGGDYVIIGGNVQRLPFSFIGRPGLRGPEDLRGKRIGVSSLNIGTSTLLRDYLGAHGLEYQKDYQLVPIGMMRRRWETLQSGEIDAGMQGTPMDTVALDEGYTDLGDIAKDIGAYQFVSLAARRSFVEQNRELTVRFLRALAAAHAWYYANREGSTAIAVAETGVAYKHAEFAWDRYTREQAFPTDGDVSVEGIEVVLKLSGHVRSIDSRLAADWQRYVDRSYFIEASSRESELA